MSRAPVVVISEPGRTPLHVLLVEPLEVGRDATGVIVADASVSRRHLQLSGNDDGVLVVDLGSANGTAIDGTRISGQAQLRPGSVVQLGDTTITIASMDAEVSAIADPGASGLTTISRLAADVATTPVAPPTATLSDGTVTIVFTDIESSTELAHGYGDEKWFGVLTRHTQMVREQLAIFGGAEIKSQGDGFMLAFDSAHRSISCMISLQRAVTELGERDPDMAVRIRVGAHTGEAIVDGDGDLFGHHVNVAARIADQAEGGEILISSLVREIVESRGDLTFGEARSTTLKGLTGTFLLHPVIWREP